MKLYTFLVVTALAFHPGITLLAAEPKTEVERFDYSVTDISLLEVLHELGRKGQCQIFASAVEDEQKNVTLEMKGTTWRECLESVARKLGMRVESDPRWGALHFLTRDPPISKTFENTPAAAALFELAKDAGQNVFVAGDFTTVINLSFAETPWSEALHKIATQAKLSVLKGPCGTWMVLDDKGMGNLKLATKAQADYIRGAQVQDEKERPDIEKKLSLEAQDTPLYKVLKEIKQAGKFRIVYDLGGKDPTSLNKNSSYTEKVTFKLLPTTCLGALEFISRRMGGFVDDSDLASGYIALRKPSKSEYYFKVADIRDIVNTIAMKESVNTVIGSEVSGSVHIRIKGSTALQSLRLFLNPLGFSAVIERGDIIRINSTELISKQIEPKGAKSGLVSMIFTRADLVDIVDTISLQSGLTFKIDESIKKIPMEVSARLENVDWQLALRAVLKSHNLVLEEHDQVLTITKPKE